MEMPEDVDVLIVGAGPSGLALAANLALLGVESMVIDKQTQGAKTSRAAVVHARTLEVLEPIGATPELLAHGFKVPTFHVRDGDRSLLRISFAELATDYPFTLMLPQDRTEQILNGRLVGLGGSVMRGIELTGLEPGLDGVAAHLASSRDKIVLNARWVVGCDGAHSIVRSAAAIAFEGGSYDEDFLLADVRMTWPLPRSEVNLFFSAQGLMVVAPLPEDRFRIVATAAVAPEHPDAAFVQSLLDDRGPKLAPATIGEVVWSSRFHLQHRVTTSPRKGRVLLCGDAAHVHSPAGGQGMNTGIQDAASLAAPLAEAIKQGQPDALDAWATRRHAVARDVVSMTDRMTRAATAKSPAARLLRNLLLLATGHMPGITKVVARRLSELDYR